MRSLASRTRVWLGGDRPWRWAAPLAVLVGLPSLALGFVADDFLLRANLLREPGLEPLHSAPWEIFHFYPDLDYTALVRRGLAPWWANPDMEARFFRPLTSLLHFVDFRLWPDKPWVMHLESVFWYAGLCAAAAAVYRRLLPGFAAGLATLLFVLDHTHGIPLAWISNRNALIAGVFGLLSLLFHHRARSGGGRADRILAPFFLALALCGGEAALGAAAYLGAYALCLERGSPMARLRTLLPFVPVGAGWVALYLARGYGVHGSGLYLDPIGAPLSFLGALPTHALLALASELGLPPPDVWVVAPLSGRALLVSWAVLALALAGAAFWPLLRRDPVARFFLVGALLAVVPISATFPGTRLTTLCSFGLLGLAARVFAGWRDREDWVPARGVMRKALVFFAVVVVGIRLLVAPVGITLVQFQFLPLGELIARIDRSVPDEASVADQHVIMVGGPDAVLPMYVLAHRAARGAPIPSTFLPLGEAHQALAVSRVDARTLLVRDRNGFYGDGFSRLTRPLDLPLPVGTHLPLGIAALEVMEVRDAIPVLIRVTFDVPLEDPSLRFLTWKDGALVPFELPHVGQWRDLEPQPHPMLTPEL